MPTTVPTCCESCHVHADELLAIMQDDLGLASPPPIDTVIDYDGNCSTCREEAVECEGCHRIRRCDYAVIRGRTYVICLACEQAGEE